MKYTTALTFLLAFGPATSVLAAPLTQGPASALTAGPAPEGQAPPGGRPAPGGPAPSGQAAPGGQPASGGSTAGGQTAPAPSGSSSEALNGASMGNEGVLDKVEKILKDLASGLRKRSIIEEVGQAAKLTLDSTSKLLNGESSGSQSSYNTQSTDPDALPSTGSTTGDNQATSATGPTPPTPPAPVSKGSSSGSSSGSGSGSQLSKLLSGRSLTDEIDPLNTSGSTAPISSSAGEPSFPGSPAHAIKGSNPVGSVAPLDTQKQNTEEDKKEKEGPNNGTAATDPLYLTPEEIEALETVLASQSQGQAKGKGEGAGADVPGLSNA